MAPKKSRELSRLRELCALDLPTPLVMPALLAELHALVPSSRNLFDWCDAQGALTRYCIEGPVDEAVARLYFDEFHNRREVEAMPSFAQALASGAVLNSAAELNTSRFFGSSLYAEIWRPQGLRYRVELIVRAPDRRPLGSLVLYRGPGEPCFTAGEEARLLPLLPHLAQALSRDAVPRCPRSTGKRRPSRPRCCCWMGPACCAMPVPARGACCCWPARGRACRRRAHRSRPCWPRCMPRRGAGP